jgi:hypothetical protein
MHQHTSSFCGASGTDYSYGVFPQDFVPQDQQFYNYVFANLSPEGRWNPVFIGQGDLKQFLSDQARLRGVAHLRSTHVLVSISPDAQQRHIEVADLLAGYPQALTSSGRNPGATGTGNRVPSQNRSAKRAFPNDQTFKNHAPSLRSQDTVWARLRAKSKV